MKNFKNYKNLKVLVTGSTGFKGSWLCYWLYKEGAKVIGVSLKPEKDEKLFTALNLNKKIDQHFINILDYKKLANLIKIKKPDIIFHLAAKSLVSDGYHQPIETFKTNIIGSANVLNLLRGNKHISLVYVTSDKCYLNNNQNLTFKEGDILGGNDNYSASKAGAEIIFNSYFKSYFNQEKLRLASARAGNVIGGGDLKKNRIIPDIYKSIKSGKKLIIRNPQSIRPWQHVLEPLSGYLILGLKLLGRKFNKNVQPAWNFGPENHNSKNVLNVAKKFLYIWNIKKRIVINKKSEFNESDYLKVNISKAKKQLNWKPKLNFDKSIKFTVDWYKIFNKNKDIENFTNDQINEYNSIK